MSKPLLVCEKASIIRYGSTTPLINPFFNWTINSNERWAIVGRVGSGKSTLGSALAGALRWVSPTPTDSIPTPWHFDSSGSTKIDITRGIDDDEVTAAQYLLDTPKARNLVVAVRDIEGTIINRPPPVFEDPLTKLDSSKKRIAEKFKLGAIAKLPMIRLSNGQLMRVRLAKSLLYTDVGDAKFLILDEPFMGLDVGTRAEFGNLLGELTKDEQFPTLMLLMRPQDTLPSWITHVMELDKLSVTFQGTHEEYSKHRQSKIEARPFVPKPASIPDAKPIVELKDVKVVSVDETKILNNVNWTIRKGEKWGLTGPNGSGKTTLLSILVGDHPQAYSNIVSLFGHCRGEPGVSIWDIKAKIGFISPEFHMHFTSRFIRGFINAANGNPAVSLFDAVCTGFGSGDNTAIVLTPDQEKAANQILKDFGLLDKKFAMFPDLSMGEQRLGLIARALVKRPELVIMDEPFQGVDEDGVEMVHRYLEREFSENSEQAMVFVSHHEEEMPNVLTNLICLEKGEVVKVV
ncbi:P-loop containing nucleoside triphosphate hydrolase protein [Obelidium mucronatum]|nr:P-loop containing nucleoside triphosphate hydrolase protein [Obelidium mucronatum]